MTLPLLHPQPTVVDEEGSATSSWANPSSASPRHGLAFRVWTVLPAARASMAWNVAQASPRRSSLHSTGSSTASSICPACACTWPRPAPVNCCCSCTASRSTGGRGARSCPTWGRTIASSVPTLRGAGWTDATRRGDERDQLVADVIALVDALESTPSDWWGATGRNRRLPSAWLTPGEFSGTCAWRPPTRTRSSRLALSRTYGGYAHVRHQGQPTDGVRCGRPLLAVTRRARPVTTKRGAGDGGPLPAVVTVPIQDHQGRIVGEGRPGYVEHVVG